MIQECFEQFKKINNVITDDFIYKFEQQDIDKIQETKLWQNIEIPLNFIRQFDPNYFKNCYISINAVIKMLVHSCLGKNNEVMGMLQGTIRGDTFVVFDIIYLNGEASETTVRLDDSSMENFTYLNEKLELIGRSQPIIGWYHSHPNYGCWLSGTDVKTQELQQKINGTSVAVVIDPLRTMMKSELDVGAFRTYPENYITPPDLNKEGQQIIPEQKIKEFGAHHNRYYSLKIKYFCNSLDQQILQNLWDKYWDARLSQSALWENKKYFDDNMDDLKGKCNRYNMEQALNEQNQGGQKQITEKNQIFQKALGKYTLEYGTALLNESIKSMMFQ